MTVRLEHANLIVRDIDGIVRFLQTAFPEFHVRHDGTSSDGRRWVHAGYAGLIPTGRAIATAVVTAAVLLLLILGYRRSAGIN